MGSKAITQIGISAIALIIIFTYIKPTLVTIGEKQDDLYEYSDASNKAAELNRQLSTLMSTAKSFSSLDMQALDSYLPSSLDSMEIMGDIVAMTENGGMQLETITSGEETEVLDDVVLEDEVIKSDGTTSVDFDLTVKGSYESFKALLQIFEQNNYPLEIVSLALSESTEGESDSVSSSESQEETYDITLRTYAYSLVQN